MEWQAKRDPSKIIQEREAMVAATEEAGAEMRASGVLAEWYAMCDERVRRVSETVNGALLAELLREGGHKEPDCADIFREGKNSINTQCRETCFVCRRRDVREPKEEWNW